MRRPYIYKDELGNLDVEIEQGLDLSNISDASSDSEAPREDDWRPPSPDIRADQKEREDNEADMKKEADEEECRRKLALQLVAQDQILALYRYQRQRRDYWRFRAGRPRTPEASQRSRPPSPFGEDEADDLDGFAHVTFSDHVFLGNNNLTADEEIMLEPEIERKVGFLRQKAAWQTRQDRRKQTRADRFLTVLYRVNEWVEGKKRKYPPKNNYYERDEAILSERALTPRLVWQRRDLLLSARSNGSGVQFTRSFLQDISVDSFYGIYLLQPEKERQRFILSGYPLHGLIRPRWYPAWRSTDQDYLKWQKYHTLKNLEVLRRSMEEDPKFDAWTERFKIWDRGNTRDSQTTVESTSPTKMPSMRVKELENMGTSILTRESLRAHRQRIDRSETHEGASEPLRVSATGASRARDTSKPMNSGRIEKARPKNVSQVSTNNEAQNSCKVQ